MSKSAVVKVLTVFLYLFALGLFVSACASARQCFTEPCYEGEGLDMLWSVHDGEGFQLLVTSMLMIAHAVATHTILFRSSYSSYKYGMLTSSCLLLSLVMLMQAGTYGSKSLMVSDLDGHLQNDQQFYEENKVCDGYNRTLGRKSCEAQDKHCEWVTELHGNYIRFGCYRAMSVDDTAKARFNAVMSFSILLCITQFAMALCLLNWRQDFDMGHNAGVESGANIAKAGGKEGEEGGYGGYGGTN